MTLSPLEKTSLLIYFSKYNIIYNILYTSCFPSHASGHKHHIFFIEKEINYHLVYNIQNKITHEYFVLLLK